MTSELPKLRTKIPGPHSRKLLENLKKFEAPTVTFQSPQWPIVWEKARGVNVWDVDGNRYLDLTSAFGVASLGHSHLEVMKAVQKQTKHLAHAMGDVHPARGKIDLCQKLSEITFERWSGGKIKGQTILGSSGFEAVEAALKTAAIYTRKRGVIAFKGEYHGLGYGALEVTSWNEFRQPFKEQLGQFAFFLDYPRQISGEPEQEQKILEQLELQIKQTLQRHPIGAILVEPFQGRGGEVIPPAGFLPLLRKICDRARILLIVDEIYTGFWRTGNWFGVEHSKVIPDLMCVGKALTGCLPLSACIGSDKVMAAWPESKGEALHTSTFLGNPLACAAALASIKIFESKGEKFAISEKGLYALDFLRKELYGIQGIREIRGIGLMLGIEVFAPLIPFEICKKLLRSGLLLLPSGQRGEVLAISPPLMISPRILEWSLEKVVQSIRS